MSLCLAKFYNPSDILNIFSSINPHNYALIKKSMFGIIREDISGIIRKELQ